MKNVIKFVLISALSAGVFACNANSTEQEAADARATAADARAQATVADARLTAADARVRAADAAVAAAAADARALAKDSEGNSSERPTVNRFVIPSGTVLKVALLDTLDSNTSSVGDHFMANLSEAVLSNGITLLPKGAKVRGRVVEVEEAGRVKGRSLIRLALTDIVQANGMIPITTETFSATGDSTQKRDAGIIAGGAGVGAVIGAIAGGKKGAAIGAATGGGAGTGVVLATKGKGIHYDRETRLDFTLTDSVQL